MKQAVIKVGGKQYLVGEGEQLRVDLQAYAKKPLSFNPLLVIDDKKVDVGTPEVSGVKVTAEMVEPMVKGEKLKIMKFKPKKRVRKLTGHRQRYSLIKITSIGK